MDDNLSGQGTRLSDTAPWDSYADEMTEKVSPQLAEEMVEYSKHRYDPIESSNQSKEELHRQQEVNRGIAKQYQWVTPEEYADFEQRIGRVMHSSVFINILRKAGIQCFYRQHVHPQKATLWFLNSKGEEEVACWVQQGFMMELSVMRFDSRGVPLDERRRGWRTCLMQIIFKQILTEDMANEIFGKPKQTKAFHKYNSTLYSFRNRGMQWTKDAIAY